MVIVELHLKVAPEKRFSVLKTIHGMTGPTSAQSGCQLCELYSNTQNDDDLILLQKWDSQESLEEHFRSDEFRKILAVMDNASEPPEIFFNKVGTIEDFGMVEKVL